MMLAIVLTAVLLAVALAVISRARWLSRLFLPTSVIAGAIGLAAVQMTLALPPLQSWAELLQPVVAQWRSWPGILIAVVFAGMLLGRTNSSTTASIRSAGREGLMVWIIVLGQTAIGLMVTWLLVQPMTDVPDAFGMLIETGFAGGHGTAAAMGQVFASDQIQLNGGLDLGIMMATVGLVYGVLSGVFWVNVGVRKGWTRKSTSKTHADPSTLVSAKTPPSADSMTSSSNAIDPLLMQLIWLTLAFAVGWLLQTSVSAAGQFAESFTQSTADNESLADRTSLSAILDSFPLFIYTLFGGWIVRKTIMVLKAELLIDAAVIGKITSAAMDILVVAAIASLNLTILSGRLSALAAMIIAAAVWTSFCLVYLSRRILPAQHWFELGLINYGMSTGTTATGFVLLKLVDPDLESGAAEDYAIAAPLSSPFVGGGMITIGLPMLVLGTIPLSGVVLVLTAIVTGLILLGIHFRDQAS